jgi:D-alanine-D-alanine ligase
MRPPLPRAAEFGRVAVLMGGWSAEREVSLNSGREVLAGLRRAGVDAHAVDATPEILRQISVDDWDHAFIVLHGRGGEDGVAQAALELAGIPYSGSGVLGSALGMDKRLCKEIWRGAGLATPGWRMLDGESDCAAALETLGLPLVIKPVLEGSSIGVAIVRRAEDLSAAWQSAREYGAVMAEQYIVGRELTCGVLQGEALPLIHVETPSDFYDYEAKYLADSTRYHCPCGLPSAQETELKRLAVRAFESVAASGWGRVDLMLDAADKPWLIEVNTVPGMTDHSLVPMAARAAGMDFEELVLRILATSQGEGW